MLKVPRNATSKWARREASKARKGETKVRRAMARMASEVEKGLADRAERKRGNEDGRRERG
ncbi:hypothetical protein Scep_009607 [Stephania cephalantha]|uniref:Uncharacterized protein n=1 Tax=Stephania cephalantha TaxID=152367 RepID=A0AAP0JTH0_9MAGN